MTPARRGVRGREREREGETEIERQTETEREEIAVSSLMPTCCHLLLLDLLEGSQSFIHYEIKTKRLYIL